MKRFLPTRNVLLLALLIALVCAGSATAGSMITGKQIKNGTIQKNDLSKSAVKALRGNSGPAGAQGPQGPAGADASSVWAVFYGNDIYEPTLVRSSGIVSVVHNVFNGATLEGQYDVTTDRDVSQCAWSVTPGSADSTSYDRSIPYSLGVEQKNPGEPNHLLVRAFDAGGNPWEMVNKKRGAHLVVTC